MKINQNYLKLQDGYLFSEIAKRVKAFAEKNTNKNVVRMGIGDVTRPLTPSVVSAMKKATEEMGVAKTFRGYADEQGYDFLRQAVCEHYAKKSLTIDADEVFISDGAKSDLGNILDIFSQENTVLVPNPVYPVYVDTNIMAGRKIVFANGSEENAFLPLPDKDVDADIIYLCSPNNPTGAVYNKEQLKMWVDYALLKQAVILFDSAYEVFVSDSNLPTSIYQIKGAKKCAIEFCSLSKTAGFTGTRCGYTVVPKDLVFEKTSLNKLWFRRQTTKFNGVPYVVQRGAEAVFTTNGWQEIKAEADYYMQNARLISKTLTELKIWHTGGINSPYIWLKCPNGLSSWQFFDFLLEKACVVGTPGEGFGKNGEGFFRFSAFGSHESTAEAMQRLREVIL